MSYESETRVVDLQFNNKQFEANVSQTLTSLDKLDAALKFDGAEKGFKDLEKAANNVHLDGIATAVENIEARFTNLGAAIKAKTIDKLADSITSFASKTMKNLTIDQVTAGWGKYEQQVGAVQTILNSTGESMEEVEAQLEKLSWYTDETSYYFDDMVNNISKFTSQGIKMADATDQMIGIANAAGLAGVNAENAGHAMEGFAKAMSKGYMDRQNWTWIQTAKMETPKLKQLFIEVAEEQNKLQKVTEDTWKVADSKDHMVSVGNFLENMKDKWLDADVMQEALRRYSSYTVKLYDALGRLGKSGITTAQVMELMGKNATINAESIKRMTNSGMTATQVFEELGKSFTDEDDIDLWNEFVKAIIEGSESADEALSFLSEDWSELGEMGMRASQETKTFADMVGAIQEVISSGWRRSFDLIIGNYEEAKEMWSTFVEDIWDIFALPAEARNELLQEWKDWGGRDDLIEGVRNLYTAVMSFITPIKEAFREVFPAKTADDLLNLTYSFKELTGNMALTKEEAKGLKSIFKTLFSVIKPIVTVAGNAAKTVGIIIRAFYRLGKILLQNATGFDSLSKAMLDTEKVGKTLRAVVIGLTLALIAWKAPALLVGSALAAIAGGLYAIGAYSWLGDKIRSIGAFLGATVVPVLQTIGSWIKSHLPSFDQIAVALDAIAAGIGWLWDKLAAFGNFLGVMYENHLKNISSLKGLVSGIWSVVTEVLTKIWNWLQSNNLVQKVLDALKNAWSWIHSNLPILTSDFMAFANSISTGQVMLLVFAAALLVLIANVTKLTKKLTTIVGSLTSVKDVFGNLNKYLTALTRATQYSGLMQLGIGLGIISASLIALTYADWDHIWEATGILMAFAAAGVLMTKFMADFSKTASAFKDTANFGVAIMAFAVSIAALANALSTLALIPWSELGNNIYYIAGAFAVLVGTMLGFMAFVKWLSTGWDSVKNVLNASAMLAFAGSVYILAMAMKELSGLPDLNGVTGAIIAVAGAFGFIMAATSQFKLSTGIGVLAAVLALKLFASELINCMPMLKQIESHILSLNTDQWVAFFGSLIVVAGAAALAGRGLAGIGFGLMAGVMALKLAVDTFGNMDDAALAKGLSAISSIRSLLLEMAAVVGIMSIIGNLFANISGSKGTVIFGGNKNPFKGMFSAFVGLGTALVLLSAALKIVSTIDSNDLKTVGTIFGILTGVFALALAAGGYAKESAKAIRSMTVAIAAIAGIVMLMSFFTNDGVNQLLEPATILGGLMVALGISMALAGSMAQKVNTGAIIGMALAAASVAAYLYFLANSGADWEVLKWGAIALGGVLLALSTGILIAGAHAEGAKAAWPALLAMALNAYIIGEQLQKLALIGSWDVMLPAMTALGGAMIALGASILIAGAHATGALASFPALLSMAVVAWTVGTQLQQLALIGSWDTLMPAMTALGGAMIALGAAILIAGINAIGAFASFPALLSMAVVALAIGHAMSQLAAMDPENLKVSMFAFAVAVGVLAGAVVLLGALSAESLIGAGVLFVLAAAMEVFVLIVTQFVTQVDKFAAAITLIENSMNGISQKAPEAADALQNAVKSMKDSVADARKNLIPDAKATWKEIGQWIPISLIEGINQYTPNLEQTAKSLAKRVEEAFRNTAGIHSLSDLWAGIANWIPVSIKSGIEEKTGDAENATSSLASKLLNQFNITLPNWYNSGQSLGQNLVNGITSRLSGVVIAGKSLGEWMEQLGLKNSYGSTKSLNGSVGQFRMLDNGVIDQYGNSLDKAADSSDLLSGAQSALEEALGGVSGALGGATGSSGKNTKALEEETKATAEQIAAAKYYTNVMNYASDTVKLNTKALIQNDDTLSDVEAEKLAIAMTEEMVLQHYKNISALDDECQGVTEFADLTAEQLIKAGQAWEDYYDQIINAMQSKFDFFNDDPFNDDLAAAINSFNVDDILFNAERNALGAEAMEQYLRQALENGLDPRIVEQLWERKDLAEIINYGKLSKEMIGVLNAQYETWESTIERTGKMVATSLATMTTDTHLQATQSAVDAAAKWLGLEGSDKIIESTSQMLAKISASTDPEATARGLGLGEYWDQGIAEGITDMIDLAVYAVRELAEAMIAELKAQIAAAYANNANAMASVTGSGARGAVVGGQYQQYSDEDYDNLRKMNSEWQKSQEAAIEKYGSFEAAKEAGAIESISDVADRLGSDMIKTLENMGRYEGTKSSASETSQAVNGSSGGSSSSSSDNSSNTQTTVNQTIIAKAPVSQKTADSLEKSAASKLAGAIA